MSPRCSVRSAARDEPLLGTASTVRSFLLVEAPGGWGVDAVRRNGLPPEVGRRLAGLANRHRVRLLMIRRHGRRTPGGLTAFLAHAGPRSSLLEGTVVSDPEQLLELDLAALAAGRSPGLPAAAGPLFLVCTHGRHDVCCAERGRPVAAALDAVHPEQTWEVSHIGGDRFAGNLLVLPHGLYYGRLSPEAGLRVAELSRRGRVDLDHLRGRSTLPFPVQAAEVFLRRHTGEDRLDAVRLHRRTGDGDFTDAEFEVAGTGRWRVRVRTFPGPPDRLTCRAAREDRPPRHELVGLERSPAGR